MSIYNIDPYFLNQKEVNTSVIQLQQMLSDRDDMLNDSRGVNPEVFRTVGNNMQKEIQATWYFYWCWVGSHLVLKKLRWCYQ